MGEIGAEEQSELGEHGPAKGKDAFLAALAVDTERAAVSVEVANLDTGQLASPDAEEEQAEQRQAVARVLGDRQERAASRPPAGAARRASRLAVA